MLLELASLIAHRPAIAIAGRCLGEFAPGEVSHRERDLALAMPLHRRTEFLTGRACARSAAAALSIDLPSLLKARSGAPEWPPSLTGSISHDRSTVAAVVSIDQSLASIGIDIEPPRAIEASLLPIICRRSEQDALQTLKKSQAASRATAIFTIKEAFYKAQHYLTNEWLDFADVETGWDGECCMVWPVNRSSSIHRLGLPISCYSISTDVVCASVVIIERGRE